MTSLWVALARKTWHGPKNHGCYGFSPGQLSIKQAYAQKRFLPHSCAQYAIQGVGNARLNQLAFLMKGAPNWAVTTMVSCKKEKKKNGLEMTM